MTCITRSLLSSGCLDSLSLHEIMLFDVMFRKTDWDLHRKRKLTTVLKYRTTILRYERHITPTDSFCVLGQQTSRHNKSADGKKAAVKTKILSSLDIQLRRLEKPTVVASHRIKEF